MAKTTLLAGLFLLGLTLIYADGTANDRCDYASFFLLDVSIQPGNGNFDCDGPKDQIKLNKLIKRISDRQFEKYFNETSYMANMTMEEGDLCQGTNGITNRPALRGTNEDRRDLVRLGVAGFLYTTSSQCRFCLEDNRDPGGAAELNDDEKNTTTSSGRSSSNWKGLDFIRTEDDVDSQLQGTLQRRLTRVLTRKVNHNVRSSCLVGSESTVTVNLTAVGNHRPWVATCPQEYPPDRETGGMGIARDQP